MPAVDAEQAGATILVVDDVESNIDMVLKILAGHDLIPATSGEEALNILEHESVDLLLLDIMMPGMDGFEVCRRLKAIPRTRDIPIIFITARDDEKSIETAYEIGGFDYVTKPFKPRELQARVQTQLTLYRQYRRLQAQNAELIRAERALLDSEERYRLAMEAARDGLWDWEVSTGRVHYSPGWRTIIGETRQRSDYSAWKERIHPDDRQRVLQSLNLHLSGQTAAWDEEHRLRRDDGSWVWVQGRGRVVQRDADGKPLRMVGTMNDISERKQFQQRIEYMAFNDTLTGLPNRVLLLDRLHQAISLNHRSGRLLAVCYLDLDGFKPVNDRYGHHLGDALLVQLARRLSEGLREGDTLARLGGDEFVILLNGLTTIYDGESIIGRILTGIDQPFEIQGHSIQVSASIGVTFHPTDNGDADTLLRHADEAMYKAKEAGKSVYRLYDPVQEQKIRSRRQSLEEFEQGLSDGQFELHYQPRVDLSSGALINVEALLRRRHPEKGLMLPGSFLPLVEGTPLELALGEWVLKQALDQHMAWRSAGLRLPVSVNISSRQIRRKGFVSFLRRLLCAYPQGVADDLELEVVESAAIGDTEEVAGVMNDCVQLGVHFALDDFGPGYASPTHFHRLPIEVLKIDQNFVKDMLDDEHDLDVVEGVLRLAYGLKRPVVAEGVESVEIGMMLLQLGCRFAQGFGIAEPMPGEQVPHWLKAWTGVNVWHDLQHDATGLSADFDLNVSIFSHRHWLEGIARYVESENPEDLPILDGRKCQFERWYRGIGLIRYGSHPSYPFIPTKHSRVHELANGLVAHVQAGEKALALAGLEALNSASTELIQLLEKLSGN